jgi:hypothetical protein
MGDETSRKLEAETRKWLTRLESEIKNMQKATELEGLDNSIENIHSYINDCRHFLEKKDFINAFEAAIYSWGIWETLLRLGLVRK